MRNFYIETTYACVFFSVCELCENMHINISVINRKRKICFFLTFFFIQYCTEWEIECKCVYRKTSTWGWVLTSKCCYIYRNIDTCVSNIQYTLDSLTFEEWNFDQYLYVHKKRKEREIYTNWSDDLNMIMQLDAHIIFRYE
jgi:hypothetical protein